jgi:hypothetical protein
MNPDQPRVVRWSEIAIPSTKRERQTATRREATACGQGMPGLGRHRDRGEARINRGAGHEGHWARHAPFPCPDSVDSTAEAIPGQHPAKNSLAPVEVPRTHRPSGPRVALRDVPRNVLPRSSLPPWDLSRGWTSTTTSRCTGGAKSTSVPPEANPTRATPSNAEGRGSAVSHFYAVQSSGSGVRCKWGGVEGGSCGNGRAQREKGTGKTKGTGGLKASQGEAWGLSS